MTNTRATFVAQQKSRNKSLVCHQPNTTDISLNRTAKNCPVQTQVNRLT